MGRIHSEDVRRFRDWKIHGYLLVLRTSTAIANPGAKRLHCRTHQARSICRHTTRTPINVPTGISKRAFPLTLLNPDLTRYEIVRNIIYCFVEPSLMQKEPARPFHLN